MVETMPEATLKEAVQRGGSRRRRGLLRPELRASREGGGRGHRVAQSQLQCPGQKVTCLGQGGRAG